MLYRKNNNHVIANQDLIEICKSADPHGPGPGCHFCPTRSEFTSRYNGLSNAAYVNALEQSAEITLTNKADLIAALNGNQKTRAQVLREIVESKAVEDKFFIRAFVAMQYFGYLRRDPDTIGYDNWVTTLTDDPSNFRHMIFGFSDEYRGRFGP
jgi:hypothetical protein